MLLSTILNVVMVVFIIAVSWEIAKGLSKRDRINEFIDLIDKTDPNDYGKIPVRQYLGGNSYIDILDSDLNIIYSGTGEYSRKYTPKILAFTSDIDKNTSYLIDAQVIAGGELHYVISQYSYEEGENREYDYKNSILSGIMVLDDKYNILYSDMPQDDSGAFKDSDIDALFDNNDSTFAVKHLIRTGTGEKRYLIAHLDSGLKPIDVFMRRLTFVAALMASLFSIILVLVLSGRASRNIREKIRDKNYHTAGYLHDIGNSATSIVGYASELSKDNNTAEENEFFLSIVLNKAEEAAELTRCLNEFNKLNASDFCLKKKPSNLAEIYKKFVSDSSKEFEANGFLLKTDIPVSFAESSLDETQLLRVFGNFKNNFIKYCDNGNVIYFGMRISDNTAVIEIGNNGSPIEPEIRAQIFKPYIKGKNSALGSGLGLAIAEKIISLHSGRIYLADDIAHECSNLFRIELPVSSYRLSD